MDPEPWIRRSHRPFYDESICVLRTAWVGQDGVGAFVEPIANLEANHSRWVNIQILATMDRLTLFGLFAVTAMLVCYAMERRSTWFILAFAAACGLGSVYGFLQGAWPFGLVEAAWSLVALHRWRRTCRR